MHGQLSGCSWACYLLLNYLSVALTKQALSASGTLKTEESAT